MVSLDEIPPLISIKVNEHFTDWALSSQQSGKLLKMKIDPNLYFYLKPSGNGYMDGFYIIKSGNLITKLDTYCSFNILSNYQSNFISFKEGGL